MGYELHLTGWFCGSAAVAVWWRASLWEADTSLPSCHNYAFHWLRVWKSIDKAEEAMTELWTYAWFVKKTGRFLHTQTLITTTAGISVCTKMIRFTNSGTGSFPCDSHSCMKGICFLFSAKIIYLSHSWICFNAFPVFICPLTTARIWVLFHICLTRGN